MTPPSLSAYRTASLSFPRLPVGVLFCLPARGRTRRDFAKSVSTQNQSAAAAVALSQDDEQLSHSACILSHLSNGLTINRKSVIRCFNICRHCSCFTKPADFTKKHCCHLSLALGSSSAPQCETEAMCFVAWLILSSWNSDLKVFPPVQRIAPAPAGAGGRNVQRCSRAARSAPVKH